jgi:hypothetical protein
LDPAISDVMTRKCFKKAAVSERYYGKHSTGLTYAIADNRDIILVAVGIALYGVIVHLHPYLLGVSAIP